MSYFLEKEVLEKYIDKGLTTRQIADIVGCTNSHISWMAGKYNIRDRFDYKKPKYTDENFFNKIDTKEKAYILGFLLGDGCLTDRGIVCSLAMKDKEILEYISNVLGANIRFDDSYKPEQKKFPSCSIYIGNKRIINDLKKQFGGLKKIERHIPIVSPAVERYLLQGFFDAEGCITWGYRKDRNRIWQKLSFTSQYKMLIGIQNILLKGGISSAIKQKGREDCFNMELANKNNVLACLDYIYQDKNFVVLKRKYDKANALRLELGELGRA